MEKIKIENFKKSYPGKQFPKYKSLNRLELNKINNLLLSKIGLNKEINNFDLVKYIEKLSEFFPNINANDLDFDILKFIKKVGVIPLEKIFVNWYRYDDIDKIEFKYFVKYFDDIWYSAVDDIDIFDESFSWLISISHEGEISVMKFKV